MPRSNAEIDVDVAELKNLVEAQSVENIQGKISQALAKTATVVVTGTNAGDLQAAIAGASDGDVIEVQTNATYDPITLPASKVFVVRAARGFCPVLSGTNCVKIEDGAADHIVSGFGFKSYTTGDTNAMGAGITFKDQGSKCQDMIFHNCSFEEVTAGSAIMMSYHRSVGGDNYANPPQPGEMSDGFAVVSCHFYKACKDGTEGAAVALRGFKNFVAYDCWIDGGELGGSGARGLLLQNCTNFIVEKNRTRGMTTNNGEGIKVDNIGTPVAVWNSGLVYDNDLNKCIEGVDCDDYADVVVVGNRCTLCSGEGISIDGGAAPAIGRVQAVGNACTRCLVGFKAEAGSTCGLYFNACWDNGTNYSILNGYVKPASNIEEARYAALPMFSSISWEDLQMSGVSLSAGPNIRPAPLTQFKDDGAGSDGVYLPQFKKSSTAPVGTKEMFFSFQIPHAYARGRDLKFHLHWSPGVTGKAGIVGWKVEYTVVKLNGTYGNTGYLDLADTVAAGDPAFEHRMTPDVTLSGSALEESSVLVCRVFRDLVSGAGGNDTWDDDTAFLLSVDIHVPQDKVGTRLAVPPWD